MFITKSIDVGFFNINVRHTGPLSSSTIYVSLLKLISTSNQKQTWLVVLNLGQQSVKRGLCNQYLVI